MTKFDVFSDVHVGDAADAAAFRQALKRTAGAAHGLLIVGDLTDQASNEQFRLAYDAIDSARGRRIPMIALGNHDVRWQGTPRNVDYGLRNPTTLPTGRTPVYTRYFHYNRPYMRNVRSKLNPADWRQPYYDQWIGGVHVLVLNTERDLKDQSYISPKQRAWLSRTLRHNADKRKPILILEHQAFEHAGAHTPKDLIGPHEKPLRKILRKYPQAVVFTGHVHNGLDVVNVYQVDGFHVVDVPSFAHADIGQDKRAGVSYRVTVDKATVRIQTWDALNGRVLAKPAFEFSVG